MRQLTMALAAIVVVVAAAVIVLFLWLRTYTPVSALRGGTYAPGPGLDADIEPTTGSGGRTVYVPAYRVGRPFDTTVTLTNAGRFRITVQRAVGDELSPIDPQAILDPGDKQPIHDLRIDAHESAIVVVRWRLDCRNEHAKGAESFAYHLRLRYSYLSLFTKTQWVELPFAVTLRCHGAPPASP